MTVRGASRIRVFPWLLWLALPIAAGWPADRVPLREYSTALSQESAEARETRHRLVAARRRGPVVMVHRGATAMAPENSIEAYVAAVDYGADGCEVDVRRTRDGVLVLFHDEGLDRVTEGFGRVSEASFRELESLRPRVAYGRPLFAPPPTFAALLDVTRERGLLLHLDLKEPAIESEVARLLDEAEAWDHVVSVNAENAAGLLKHPRLRPLSYKAPGLYLGRRDMDPSAVASALAQPGDMILVDDPRVATQVLGRPPYRPQPYTRTLRLAAVPPLPRGLPSGGELLPLSLTRALAAQPQADAAIWLIGLMDGRNSAAGPPQRLIERAWAAQRLGELGRKSRRVVTALLQQARQPSAHPDWAYHGLDAATSIRALARLKATESARELIGLLHQADGQASRKEDGREGRDADSSPVLRESRQTRVTTWVLPALGELRCRTARRFLERYVRASEDEVRRFGPPQYEEATRALLHQRLAWNDIADLLRSPNLAVRGTVIIECLDYRTEERGLALHAAAPWVLSLPRARR